MSTTAGPTAGATSRNVPALREGNGGTGRTRPSGAVRRSADSGEGLANALGWFSIGLGVAQIVAPRAMSRLVGVDDDGRNAVVMRTLGLREITAGIGILSKPRAPEWVWSRVAGDMMDLAMLGKALTSSDNRRGKTTAATLAVLGVTALDVLCADQLSRRAEGEQGKSVIRVRKSITVGRPPEEVYAFWHDFENLPRFMRHLEEVRVVGERRTRWRAKAPAGMTVEWDAVVTQDRPNELIAWRSVEGSEVFNAGDVRFREAPRGSGTEVTVELQYEPPGGRLTAKLAKLFREEPGQQVADDLRTFKQVMETGEVMRSDASIFDGPHAAQPPERTPTARV